MKRNSFRLIIILATISILGITIIQIFWFRKAFLLNEKQFNRTIHIALKNVAEKMIPDDEKYGHVFVDPVSQLSSNYFVVMINDVIDANILELLLINEFEKRNIQTEFEYGIYDCLNEKMVYGNYIDQSSLSKTPSQRLLPKWENDNYYFGVYFPSRTSTLFSQMNIWLFSSFVLLLVIIFFAYTLFMIFKQKRLAEIQRDFINNMTHEFKTPISTISISSEVLKNHEIIRMPEKILNYATIIQEESYRLKNQVDRVLQIATADAEVLKLKKEIIDVHSVIKENIEKCHLAFNEKEITIKYSLNAQSHCILGDNLHIRNVIYNLLDNAIKYSKELPFVNISTFNHKKGLMIQIEDKGVGIPKDCLNKVFDKFYRVPTGNLHDVKGFGLGLNYARLICKAHLGNITLKSKENEGSIFSIFLPCLKNS